MQKTFLKLTATTVVEQTGSIRNGQQLLGHTSSRTTELYLGRGAEARAAGVAAVESLLGEEPESPGGPRGGPRTPEKVEH